MSYLKLILYLKKYMHYNGKYLKNVFLTPQF